jgi:tripartite-type tricarboxylate transporter receptor subunit TctC
MLRLSTRVLLLVGILGQFAGYTCAQSYPSKIVRYIVADSAGGLADAVGRSVAAGMTEIIGQQVIVENRSGAGTNIGAAYVAKAPADGYTLLQLSQTHTVNATLYRNLSYDLLRDFAPITRVGSSPTIVVVHPSLPVKSIAELVKLAKARPVAITFASAGSGTMTFVSAELFKTVAAVDMLHVPYRGGGEAITAVMSGETALYFGPLSSAMQPARAGQLRALAVTSKERVPMMPELPTVAESGYPGFESGGWFGLMVPAKTPKETIAIIHRAAVAALNRAEVRKRMETIGFTPIIDQPEELAVFVKSEIDKWGKIIRAAGLTVD